jgi:hypothetical protein
MAYHACYTNTASPIPPQVPLSPAIGRLLPATTPAMLSPSHCNRRHDHNCLITVITDWRVVVLLSALISAAASLATYSIPNDSAWRIYEVVFTNMPVRYSIYHLVCPLFHSSPLCHAIGYSR